MKRQRLAEALDHISDQHIAEAASQKQPRIRWIGTIAAVLALILVIGMLAKPLTLGTKAVSLAEYPTFQRYYWESEDAVTRLSNFYASSMTQTLSGHTDNQTFSPVNLYLALCLMAELNRDNAQILELLNADSTEALRKQANEIWNACYRDDGDQTLLANSLWLDNHIHYNQETMDTLAGNYYTSVYQSDLQSRKTQTAIQNWLNSQTHNLLRSDVDNISADPQTILLLYSTVYFQAKWADEFRRSNNTQALFHSPDGDVTCTFMNRKHVQTDYYWAEDFGAIQLWLKGNSSMWLILPDADKTLDQVLASEEYAQLLFDRSSYENSKYMKVNLSIPKFDIRANGDLKKDLQALGITDIFTEKEDALYFTNVNQATRVAIDEKGVTAASYIEIPGAGAAQPPEEIIDFVLDRPFLFVITTRDMPLFAGIVNQPV